MSIDDEDRAAGLLRAQDDNDLTAPLRFWREYTAEMFTEEMRAEVLDYVQQTESSIDVVHSATLDDADAAIMLALRMPMPSAICLPLDVTMTVLMCAAFEDSVAAGVMADLVKRAPLHPSDRTGISTSWRIRKIWCESVEYNTRKRGCTNAGRSKL